MEQLSNPCLIYATGVWMLAECPHLSKSGDPLPYAYDDPRMAPPPPLPVATAPTQVPLVPEPRERSIDEQRKYLETLLPEEDENAS